MKQKIYDIGGTLTTSFFRVRYWKALDTKPTRPQRIALQQEVCRFLKAFVREDTEMEDLCGMLLDKFELSACEVKTPTQGGAATSVVAYDASEWPSRQSDIVSDD